MTTPDHDHTHDDHAHDPKGQKDVTYVQAYMSGGGARGKLILASLIFGEAITRRHTTKLFNLLAGDSVGAAISGTLNTPRAPGSDEPRYTAIDADAGFQQVIQRAIPKRTGYYPVQIAVDLLSLLSNGIYFSASWGFNKIDHSLSSAVNAVGRYGHNLFNSESVYTGVDIRLVAPVYEVTLKPLMKGWVRFVDILAIKSKYNISELYSALDAVCRFETTGEKVLLGDTIISHHVAAMNATHDQPHFMAHIKDINRETIYISDPALELDDIGTGSSSAQTIFNDHVMQNGERLSDIAHVNTAFSSMRTSKRHLNGRGYKQRMLIFNTGEAEREDLARMPAMLLLQQLMSSYGAPLMRRITSFITKRDMAYLQEDLGADNVISFDIPLTRETVQIKYADSPKVVRMAKILGFDLLERDAISETERLPTQNIFDTSDRTMQKLGEWGWDIVWHNAETMVREYKFLLQNSANQGRIDAEEARKALEDIDWLYPPGDAPIPETAAPPHQPFPNVPELIKQNNFYIDFQEPKGVLAKLRAIFNGESGAKPIIVRQASNENHRQDIQQQDLKYM